MIYGFILIVHDHSIKQIIISQTLCEKYSAREIQREQRPLA